MAKDDIFSKMRGGSVIKSVGYLDTPAGKREKQAKSKESSFDKFITKNFAHDPELAKDSAAFRSGESMRYKPPAKAKSTALKKRMSGTYEKNK